MEDKKGKLEAFKNWMLENKWYHIGDNKYLGEQWISPYGGMVWVDINELNGNLIVEAVK